MSKQADDLNQKLKMIDKFSSFNQGDSSEFFTTFGEEAKDLACEFQTLLSYMTPKRI
ncbi:MULTISPECIES: hypothetical protein [Streptococcus]|uniref:hypothetical protein n=1 Tax=Streptococcus TaxID=1301 RepID=UPI000B0C6662|nr:MULTISPECIES: hypothetical protein [Streptococcus]MDU7908551.1 hypothetical protein [Streptococcus lutetiensis]MEE0354739.1 hypothetical protein [Streptococcus lutetiensis]